MRRDPIEWLEMMDEKMEKENKLRQQEKSIQKGNQKDQLTRIIIVPEVSMKILKIIKTKIKNLFVGERNIIFPKDND